MHYINITRITQLLAVFVASSLDSSSIRGVSLVYAARDILHPIWHTFAIYT